MDELRVLSTLTAADRAALILADVEVVEQWRRFALLRRRETGDDELWSVRDGRPWHAVLMRLPATTLQEFAETHRRMEARLWLAMVDAARNCSNAADSAREALEQGVAPDVL